MDRIVNILSHGWTAFGHDLYKNLDFGRLGTCRLSKVLKVPKVMKIGEGKMEIEQKEYYCPSCEKGFDIPQDYVSPCCFTGSDEIQDGSQREQCKECGEIFECDYIIAVCPHCGNDGSWYAEPGHWECMGSYIEAAQKRSSKEG